MKIYTRCAGLHFNIDFQGDLNDAYVKVLKMQPANSQDFNKKFEYLKDILKNFFVNAFTLTFVPDFSRALESFYVDSDGKDIDIFLPQCEYNIPNVTTYIYGRDEKVRNRYKKLFMEKVLKSNRTYYIHSIFNADTAIAYLDVFQEMFIKSFKEGTFISYDSIDQLKIVEPSAYMSTKDIRGNFWSECNWIDPDEVNAYHAAYSSPPVIDTGTIRRH